MEEFNEEYFEKVIMKKIMTDNTSTALLINKLQVGLFSRQCYQNVFKFYHEFFNKHSRLPKHEEIKISIRSNALSVDFMTTLKDTKEIDLSQMEQTFFLEGAERFIKRRMAIVSIKQIVDSLKQGEINPDRLVDIFTKVAQVKIVQNIGYDIYADIQRYIDEWSTSEARLSFGYDNLDSFTNGGMPSKGKFLGVVAAPTNMGKSIFLGNIATNAVKQGKRVLIISLEMSEMVYASRIYADLYNMDIDSVNVSTQKVKENVEREHTGRMIIKEFPPATLTVEELDGYLDSLRKAGHEFDLVCVDYLTLLRAPGVDNSNEAGKMLSRKLRALSYKYEIPFFTAAQLNRDGFDGTPELQNMAESIAICAEADFIIMLYQQEEDEAQDIMRCSIKKSRLGRKDVDLRFRFNLRSLRFEDMEPTDLIDNDDKKESKVKRSAPSDEIQGIMDMIG